MVGVIVWGCVPSQLVSTKRGQHKEKVSDQKLTICFRKYPLKEGSTQVKLKLSVPKPLGGYRNDPLPIVLPRKPQMWV
jgi:hypothetical protein